MAGDYYKRIENTLKGNGCLVEYYWDGEFSQNNSRICHTKINNVDVVILLYSLRNQSEDDQSTSPVWKIHSEGSKRTDPASMVPTRNKALRLAKDKNWKFITLGSIPSDEKYSQDPLSNYFLSIESYSYGDETGYNLTPFIEEMENANWPVFKRSQLAVKSRKGTNYYYMSFVHKDILLEYLSLFDNRAYGSTSLRAIKFEDVAPELTEEVLGEYLKQMYESAQSKVSAFHLFGIKYGEIIVSNSFSVKKIIEASGLQDSYATELNKGISIYKSIASSEFDLGLSYDDSNISCSSLETHCTKSFSVSGKRFETYSRSLIAKPFVIIAGNSGTGKTKVAIDLSIRLGVKDLSSRKVANSLIVPVGADWTDNTKVLGFYNPLNKTYESTPILDFIILARNNPDVPFFLILDEMNLSHVERYFSDFLSAMESGEPIPLYKKDDDCNCNIPESIEIPKNLFVTGTVNIDETTYMFSPKVLDRANVIEFIPEMKDVLDNFEKEPPLLSVDPANDGSAEGFLFLAKQIREEKEQKLPEKAQFLAEILRGIYEKLSGSGFEFAFRTTKEIRKYVIAASKLAENAGKELSESDYVQIMDEQLLQKILPKIHGNRTQIGDLLKNLSKYCANVRTINDQVVGLPMSKAKIDKMIETLKTSQFASFI